MSEPVQQTLDLEIPVPEHYDIELRRDEDDGDDIVREGDVLRHHEAETPEDALAFVEALRDDATVRYMVTWQSEEPRQSGKMYGLAPGGITYAIAVSPPLELV